VLSGVNTSGGADCSQGGQPVPLQYQEGDGGRAGLES